MNEHRFGWRPDLPDHRDLPAPRLLTPPPAHVDLRPLCPSVLDQGNLGSCTANAIANAHRFDQMKQGKVPFGPSRLFTYFNAREMENSILSDSGSAIRDGFKSIVRQGVPSEGLWPYDVSQFAVRPPATVYDEAMNNQALVYRRVSQTLSDMRGCLALGFPFVFGFTVYDSFDAAVAATYIASMPGQTEGILGGHAVLCVGYDTPRRIFIVQNSWGTSWGFNGFFGIPFDYLTNPDLASDFWMCQVVE